MNLVDQDVQPCYIAKNVRASCKKKGGGVGEGSNNLQTTMPTTQATHALCLDARHTEKILRVRQVGGELSELGVELSLDTKR